MIIYANTRRQLLSEHCFAVGYLAQKIAATLAPNNSKIADAAFVAGIWHDMGKVMPDFQQWLAKKGNGADDDFSDGVHMRVSRRKSGIVRHNELSALIFRGAGLQKSIARIAEHAIYWHHAKPIRDGQDVKTYADVYSNLNMSYADFSLMISSVQEVLADVRVIASGYAELAHMPAFNEINIDAEDIEYMGELPKYKFYSVKQNVTDYDSSIKSNAANNVVRAAVISADRLISSRLDGGGLSACIKNKKLDFFVEDIFSRKGELAKHIKKCLNGFNRADNQDRNKAQSEAAKMLSDNQVSVGVLRGAAGCGKTKIALEWALNTRATKIYWICPRVQICEGLFIDLTSGDYLPNAKIEIYTGDNKQTFNDGLTYPTSAGNELTADVVITTIDQIVKTTTTHGATSALVDFLNSHVVFDEFHEYIPMSGLNMLFAEIVECKKMQRSDEQQPNTLLVSATPNPLFVTEFLNISIRDIVKMDSFNDSKYQVELVRLDNDAEDDSNPLFAPQPAGTFVICNAAVVAQKGFIANQHRENAILLHSKYMKRDRESLFKSAFASFCKGGSKSFDILRSGQVIQASLNITCDRMVSEATHAENCLQRMGRLDRFGENIATNKYIIAVSDGVRRGKCNDSTSRFLNSLRGLQSATAWCKFLENTGLCNRPLNINEIYAAYDRFYQNESSVAAVREDLLMSLKDGAIGLERGITEPICIPESKKNNEKGKIKQNSLRGDNRYAQMAVCKINEGGLDFMDEYAYSEAVPDNTITCEVERICGYGNASKNLLTFMAKKHHNIKKEAKKSYKDSILLNEARSSEKPIFLSYTPEDLAKVNTEANSSAIYYAHGEKQPIGMISLQHLNNHRRI